VLAYTLPGFATSEATKTNALALIDPLGDAPDRRVSGARPNQFKRSTLPQRPEDPFWTLPVPRRRLAGAIGRRREGRLTEFRDNVPQC